MIKRKNYDSPFDIEDFENNKKNKDLDSEVFNQLDDVDYNNDDFIDNDTVE
ncbi:MAG: hypothetical protein GX231_01050 [Tissierellia bacterium]|nr:hypothetical protein [Tissierellia bacterium]